MFLGLEWEDQRTISAFTSGTKFACGSVQKSGGKLCARLP